MVNHDFRLTVQLAQTGMEAEQRYVVTEREYARRRMHETPRRWWLRFSYPALGILRHEDWQHYLRELDHYGHQLERFCNELQRGLTPVKINIANISGRDDSRVRIRIQLEGAAILVHKKPPKRPKRIDGAPDKSEVAKFHGFSGFMRTAIKIEPRSLEAVFSQLEAHDSALVVNQTLYIDSGHEGRLSYEITSRNVHEAVRGEVALSSKSQ